MWIVFNGGAFLFKKEGEVWRYVYALHEKPRHPCNGCRFPRTLPPWIRFLRASGSRSHPFPLCVWCNLNSLLFTQRDLELSYAVCYCFETPLKRLVLCFVVWYWRSLFSFARTREKEEAGQLPRLCSVLLRLVLPPGHVRLGATRPLCRPARRRSAKPARSHGRAHHSVGWATPSATEDAGGDAVPVSPRGRRDDTRRRPRRGERCELPLDQASCPDGEKARAEDAGTVVTLPQCHPVVDVTVLVGGHGEESGVNCPSTVRAAQMERGLALRTHVVDATILVGDHGEESGVNCPSIVRAAEMDALSARRLRLERANLLRERRWQCWFEQALLRGHCDWCFICFSSLVSRQGGCEIHWSFDPLEKHMRVWSHPSEKNSTGGSCPMYGSGLKYTSSAKRGELRRC